MSSGVRVNEETANRLYDIVVKTCGAVDTEFWRHDFVMSAMVNGISEYRFGGHLGMGGKLYSRPWRVSCYRDDRSPDRDAMIESANRQLKDIDTKGTP